MILFVAPLSLDIGVIEGTITYYLLRSPTASEVSNGWMLDVTKCVQSLAIWQRNTNITYSHNVKPFYFIQMQSYVLNWRVHI